MFQGLYHHTYYTTTSPLLISDAGIAIMSHRNILGLKDKYYKILQQERESVLALLVRRKTGLILSKGLLISHQNGSQNPDPLELLVN